MSAENACSVSKSNAIQLSVAVERHLHLQARIDESDHASGLVAAFHTETALHFVLPFAIFGSLWDRMQDLRPFTHQPTDEWSQSRMAESEIRWWAGQMIASIEWLHNLNYVHRYARLLGSTLAEGFVGISSHTITSYMKIIDSS